MLVEGGLLDAPACSNTGSRGPCLITNCCTVLVGTLPTGVVRCFGLSG